MYCNAPDQKIIRAPAACRRRLVFVRAGGGAPWPFRTGWRGPNRSYDIAVSYFAPPDEDSALFRNADFILAGGLSKFHAGQKFLQNSRWLAHCQSVLFVDDDILFKFPVDEFLAFCTEQKFAVAQPALSADSYYTFEITRHHPGMVYRATTFVEAMCPLISAPHLRRVIHTFDRCISSYGLDIFWSATVPSGEVAAITDCFQMRHTRPITNGGAFYKYLESTGVDRWAELRDMLVSLGMTSYPIVPKHCHFKPDCIPIPRVSRMKAADAYSA